MARKPVLSARFMLALLLGLSLARGVMADDWPQWRGLNRDGVWQETGLVERFDQPQLEIRWRVEIGSGYSGPSVADGRVYVTDRLVTPQEVERIHCFHAATGEKIWTHAYECEYRNVGYDAGPRTSVTLHGGRAYCLGTMGHFFCYDAADGSVIWSRDLNAEYKIRMPMWGIAASPVVEGDVVIVQIGGEGEACLVAFEKTTGQERWKALADEASYSSPLVIDQAGRRVLVCMTGQNVVGLDPATGSVYWQQPFPPTMWVIGIATPVVHRDWLFLTNCNDGSLMLRLDPDKPSVEKVWQRRGKDERNTDALHSLISTPYLEGNYVYGIDSYAELRCLDATSGERLWESLEALPKLHYGTIHMVRNRDKVWMFTDRGELIIAKLSPQGYEEFSRAQLIEPTTKIRFRPRGAICWAHPAFANRHVFARNDHELVCANLEKKP